MGFVLSAEEGDRVRVRGRGRFRNDVEFWTAALRVSGPFAENLPRRQSSNRFRSGIVLVLVLALALVLGSFCPYCLEQS